MKVEIPNPCHENWAQMSPTERGRFCLACRTEVVDFSQFSDADIQAFFSKTSHAVCGRFRQAQLDRPLLALPTQTRKRPSAWWLSFLLLVGACEENRTSPPITQAEAVGKTETKPAEKTEDEPTTRTVRLKGVVLYEKDNKPIANARIALGIVPVITEKDVIARTDWKGEFEVTVRLEKAAHVFFSFGTLLGIQHVHELSWDAITEDLPRQTFLLPPIDPRTFVTGYVRRR